MLNGGVNMGYLEDLIKSKQVQQGDTTQKTVAPIVRHARMRAKVTREAEEGTNRLWQLRTQPKVIQQDNRTTTQKTKDRKEADEKHQQYQQQLNEQKATEGFDNLLKLTSPSTYVEAATGQQLTPAGKLATDVLAFGIADGVKSLLTRGGIRNAVRGIKDVPWIYKIPENEAMAYRIMDSSEKDWILSGKPLSSRSTNPDAITSEKIVRTKSGRTFNFFKQGAEHGGRKQFAKGHPWQGSTVTHGEKHYLAIPGKDIQWVSGRHYIGPEGTGFGAGPISFETAPIGSHIDIKMENGLESTVNPSLLDGSVIYSPFKILGRNFGYKKSYPKITIPDITAKNAINITPEQWTAAQDAAIARGDMAEAQRLRDLHFKTKAFKNKLTDKNGNPVAVKHHGNVWNVFDPDKTMSGTLWTANEDAFKLNNIKTFPASDLPTEWKNLYINMKNPIQDEVSIGTTKMLSEIRKGSKDAIKESIRDYGISNPDGVFNRVKITENSLKKNGYDLNDPEIQEILNNPEFYGKEPTIAATAYPNNIKLADAVTYDNNGVRIPLGERDNFDINDIRWFSTHPITRASKVHLTRNNPLQTRLARLREHTRYGFTPETNQGLMITPRIRSHYVKAFAKQIDPNLTEEQLNQIVQIAYANGRGMHIPIGNDIGETVGGLSIVDIQNAIKYLKQSGIKDVTPNDIGIIAGHEAGHGVQISPAAKRAIEGFSEPDEFYTRAGQVLDAAGIKSTEGKRIQFNQFMNMIDDYLSKGNLDNGVSEIRDFLRSKTKAVDRQNIMKYINELSGFSGAAYLGSKYYEKKIHSTNNRI